MSLEKNREKALNILSSSWKGSPAKPAEIGLKGMGKTGHAYVSLPLPTSDGPVSALSFRSRVESRACDS